jgi:gluconokinase
MVILIMGVSGSGKTTIGQMLAAQLNWQFQDADDLHSPANIEQMRAGIPLTDTDRRPWLRSIRAEIDASILIPI